MKTRIPFLAIASAGLASAAVTTDYESFSFNPNGNRTLSLARFDTTLGTLTAIQIRMSYTKSGGTVSGDNDSATIASVDFISQVSLYYSSSVATLKDGSNNYVYGAKGGVPISGTELTASDSTTIALQPTSGDDVEAINATYQTDYATYNGATTTLDSPEQSIGSSYWAAYEETDTFALKVTGTSTSSVDSSSSVQYAVTAPTVTGIATSTYTYTPASLLPKPVPQMMLCIGLVGTLLVRRRTI